MNTFKRQLNSYEKAALASSGLGKFVHYVQCLGGTVERYGNSSYGLTTKDYWITGSKEQILEEIHKFIIS